MIEAVPLNSLQAPAQQPQELTFLDKIIDKKVNGVALNCFEAIVDWFLRVFSCCYPSYDRLYQERRVNIIPFAGCQIEDRTARKIVTVTTDDLHDQAVSQFFAQRPLPRIDYITLNDKKVLFARPTGPVLFGRQYNTDHIVIKDVADHPGQVSIVEYETTGDVKPFIVDTNKRFIRTTRFGMPLHQKETVYVTEEAIARLRDTDRDHLYPAPAAIN